jgi:xyloglucan-specific exo-beta-1,4-glucanase
MNRIITIISFLCLSLNLNAQVNWKNVSTLGMGYVDGLTINPINNAKYVRTDVGGVFRFDDANQKWINLFDNLISINQRDISSVESFAIDKTTSGNNQVIYALSGNYGYKSYLLKSTNNGQTWTINQDWDETRKVFGNGAWRCSGEKLAIDPNNSNVVYCGTRFDGLFKTTNAATNWNKVTSFIQTGGNGGLPEKGGISFVVFDPSTTISVNSQTVSKNIYVGLIDEGIYRSNDGGQTWCFLANGFDINLYNPVRAVFSNNKLIIATMQDGDGYIDGEVWQFVPNAGDCSGTYTNKTPGVTNNYNCPYFGKYMYNAVAVRPGFPNTVYVAIRGLMPRKIFYTENFDAQFPNWKILTNEGDSGYQSCLNKYQASNFSFPASWVNTDGYDWTGDIGFDQTDTKKLWMTSGNGVLKIEDITANPAQISSQTVMKDLEILCVNSMFSPPLPNTTPLFSNVMDILAVKYQNLDNGGFAKLDPTFGLGASISMDYSFQNPNTMALIGQDYNNPATINRFLKTNDGGTTWQPFWTTPNSCNDAPWGGNIAVSATNPNNFVWIPNNKSSITGCANPVKNFPRFTTNGGTTWTFCNNINFPDGSFDFSFNSTFSIGKLLESDKVNGSKFYFYAMEGNTFVTKLWRTTDGGANWTAMSTGAMPITGNGQLKANPFLEDDIWFAPFNNYILQNDTNPNSRKLWHSTNGGSTWSTLATIQEVYAFGFGMKKQGTNVASLIVYGKIGSLESLFVSYDLGQTFTDIGTANIPEGLIGNIEGDMKIQNRIYVSTGCRGAWYGDVTNSLGINQVASNSEKLVIYPNPAIDFFSVSIPNNDFFVNLKVSIYDLQGRVVKSKILKNKLDTFETNNLTIGIYIAEIEIDNKKYNTQLIINN